MARQSLWTALLLFDSPLQRQKRDVSMFFSQAAYLDNVYELDSVETPSVICKVEDLFADAPVKLNRMRYPVSSR